MTTGRMRKFRDRKEAAQELATLLREYAGQPDVVVLGLPRGGVTIAAEIASTLGVRMDVLVVRKIGAPSNAGLAVGAVAHGGMMVLDDAVMQQLELRREDLAPVIHDEEHELERREEMYRGTRDFPNLRGQTVILVDDGLATGATMVAAVLMVRFRRPARIVVAVPVASRLACNWLRHLVDRVVCVVIPEPFRGVRLWYLDFAPPSDEKVHELVTSASTRSPAT